MPERILNVMRMNRWITVGLAVLLGIGLLVYGMHAFVMYAYHGDSCHVIALEVAGRIGDGRTVSPAALNKQIAFLIKASVIHGHVALDGVATDLNKNAFVIEIDRDKKSVTVRTRACFWQPIANSHSVAF